MYYEIYESIKDRLSGLGVQTEWYNAQYEGSIIPKQIFFVEFLKSPHQQLSKQYPAQTLRVRIHVASKIISNPNGSIKGSQIQANETLALNVKGTLNRFVPVNGTTKLCTPLVFDGFDLWQRYKGWVVSFVEFDAKEKP